MSIRVYCGTPYPIAEGNAAGVAEYVLSCSAMGAPVTWVADTPAEDHAVSVLLCAVWGVPFRTVSETEAVAYGSSEDRAVPTFGIDPSPRDYLD